MSKNIREELLQPTSLQEAQNMIKFLKISHKQEINKMKEAYGKQTEMIKVLENTRKNELEYLSGKLEKYELNLALRTESVRKQLAQKDDIIQKQLETINELNMKLKSKEGFVVPDIVLQVESNSDSGVAMDNEESSGKNKQTKTESKTVRKGNKRFADSINFLRRVDFSPMKYKPREGTKKKDDKKKNLEVPSPNSRVLSRQYSTDKVTSDDDRPPEDALISEVIREPIVLKPKKMNDSMNNHFSDDGSEDTSEEIFDRVMARSSIRRSVKANPKYKKINRTKSKLLSQVKVNIVD